MSLSLLLTPSPTLLFSNGSRIIPIRNPQTLAISQRPIRHFAMSSRLRAVHREGESGGEHLKKEEEAPASRLENILSTAASLYPFYVTFGGMVACFKPSAFSWFVSRGPASYSLSLGFIMLSMGLTLQLQDLLRLFMQRPLSILFGCVAQYTIMPALGFIISKCLGLSPSLSVGLILLGCCPGGTASNVVTLIAEGDVALSVVMTVCTTLGAVLLTPLLTKILVGAYVPVDAVKLSISTLQVVVAPIVLGSYLQSAFPASVRKVTPFSPLFAVLLSSLLACSVFSENVLRLKSTMIGTPLASDASFILRIKSAFSGDLGTIVLSVVLLHLAGFFVGYFSAAIGGFKERQRRAIAIEVGMQNSSLGVVLATAHFSSSMVALPPAVSAVVMNIMGSSLGFIWKHIDPSSSDDDAVDDQLPQGQQEST
ncbi:Probable sodium/metabolite cotransporter BASS2, chloroplastic [Linum perenne]